MNRRRGPGEYGKVACEGSLRPAGLREPVLVEKQRGFDLTAQEKEMLDVAIAQADRGECIPLDDVLDEISGPPPRNGSTVAMRPDSEAGPTFEVTPEEEQELLEAIDEADRGELVPAEEVMAMVRSMGGKTNVLTIPYDCDLLLLMGQTQAEFEDEMRFLLAVKLFELRRLSVGRAAEFCGRRKIDFIDALGRLKIPVINLEGHQIADELRDD